MDSELLATGSRFGDFTVEWLLGKSGLGAVYLVRADNGKALAAKVLPSGSMTHAMRQGLANETRLLQEIRHRSLVRFRDVGDDPESGLCFIFMDYLPGGTLAERIKSRGRIPASEAVDIAVKIAEALEFLHVNGYVHRDVTPGNIMFADDGTPVLTDTGIVRFDGGTSAYMAPEQLINSRSIDARADIYSLGAVLWEMLTGKSPAGDKSELDLLAWATEGKPLPNVRSLCPDVPEPVANAVARLCAPKAEVRPATIREAADLLRTAAAGHAVPPPPGAEAASAPTPAAAAPRATAATRAAATRNRIRTGVPAATPASIAAAPQRNARSGVPAAAFVGLALVCGAALFGIFQYAQTKISEEKAATALARRNAAEAGQKATDAEEELAKLKKKVAEAQHTITEMENTIAELAKKADEAEVRALASEGRVESLKDELETLKTALRIAGANANADAAAESAKGADSEPPPEFPKELPPEPPGDAVDAPAADDVDDLGMVPEAKGALQTWTSSSTAG